MGWGVVYYRTEDGKVPAEEFLDGLPAKVAARFDAVLDTVRAAPPPQFSGGGTRITESPYSRYLSPQRSGYQFGYQFESKWGVVKSTETASQCRIATRINPNAQLPKPKVAGSRPVVRLVATRS